MRFYIDYNSELKDDILRQKTYSLPIDNNDEYFPILFALTGIRIFSDNIVMFYANKYGIKNDGESYIISFIHKDKINHYRNLYDTEKEWGNSYITIDDRDIITKIYNKKQLYNTFPEKQQLEKELKEGVKEKLLSHFQIEEKLNAILV